MSTNKFYIFISFKMTEENQKNTVATVGMIFSIVWLILLITVIFAWFWLPLLFVWFILWIIGLFYKPRGKARVAICIPLVVFITIASIICWLWSSIKTPTMQFVDWAKVEFENIDEETFDENRFKAITNEEFNNITSTIDEDEFTSMIENSTWSNILEKLAYTIFALGQQGLENSLEKYYDESYEVNSTENNIKENTWNTNESEENTDTDNTDVENVDVFTESEKNDIEQILNILE